MNNLPIETYESVVQQRDALEKKLADCHRENLALIEQAEEVYAAGYNHGHLNTVDGIAYSAGVKDEFYQTAIELMNEAETPATDAYLALIKSEAQSEVIEWLDAEITAIDTMYRGDPSYVHDAYWMKSEALDIVELARKAFSSRLRKGINDAQ